METAIRVQLLAIAKDQLAGAQVEVLDGMFMELDEQRDTIERLTESREDLKRSLAAENKINLAKTIEIKELRGNIQQQDEMNARDDALFIRERACELVEANAAHAQEMANTTERMFNTVFANVGVKRTIFSTHNRSWNERDTVHGGTQNMNDSGSETKTETETESGDGT